MRWSTYWAVRIIVYSDFKMLRCFSTCFSQNSINFTSLQSELVWLYTLSYFSTCFNQNPCASIRISMMLLRPELTSPCKILNFEHQTRCFYTFCEQKLDIKVHILLLVPTYFLEEHLIVYSNGTSSSQNFVVMLNIFTERAWLSMILVW